MHQRPRRVFHFSRSWLRGWLRTFEARREFARYAKLCQVGFACSGVVVLLSYGQNALGMAAKVERSRSVGWAIRSLRKAHTRTLEDVAEAVGWAAGNLSRVERGRQDIPESRLQQIAGALGVTMSELYAIAESGDDDAAQLLVTARTLTGTELEQLLEYADFLVARKTRD